MKNDTFEASPDQLDQASRLEESERSALIEDARRAANEMPVGYAGDCGGCGEYYIRLVNGLCGFCRDKAKKRGKLVACEY